MPNQSYVVFNKVTPFLATPRKMINHGLFEAEIFLPCVAKILSSRH